MVQNPVPYLTISSRLLDGLRNIGTKRKVINPYDTSKDDMKRHD